MKLFVPVMEYNKFYRYFDSKIELNSFDTYWLDNFIDLKPIILKYDGGFVDDE